MPTDKDVKPSVEEVVAQCLALAAEDEMIHCAPWPQIKLRLTQAADLLSSLEARALTAEARLAEAVGR